jgi:hypothetical protein
MITLLLLKQLENRSNKNNLSLTITRLGLTILFHSYIFGLVTKNKHAPLFCQGRFRLFQHRDFKGNALSANNREKHFQ